MEAFHLLLTSEYLPWFEISAVWLFLRLSETALLRAMNNNSFFAYLFFLFFNYFPNLPFFVLGFYLLMSFLFLIYLVLSFFTSLLHLPKN